MILNHHTPASFGLLALWYLSLAGVALFVFAAAAAMISFQSPVASSDEVSQRFAGFALVAVPAVLLAARASWSKYFSALVSQAKEQSRRERYGLTAPPPLPVMAAFHDYRVTALQARLQNDEAFLLALAQKLKEHPAAPPPPVPQAAQFLGRSKAPSYAERLSPRRKTPPRAKVLSKQETVPANES